MQAIKSSKAFKFKNNNEQPSKGFCNWIAWLYLKTLAIRYTRISEVNDLTHS